MAIEIRGSNADRIDMERQIARIGKRNDRKGVDPEARRDRPLESPEPQLVGVGPTHDRHEPALQIPGGRVGRVN
jgi:hypothetical protein